MTSASSVLCLVSLCDTFVRTDLTLLSSDISSPSYVCFQRRCVSIAKSASASNWILKKMKPSRWLPLIVSLWGLVTTLSGLVQNFSGLTAVRFFLGLCEGGLLPGLVCTDWSISVQKKLNFLQILYLSTIYKRHELQLRVGIFYASGNHILSCRF